MDIRALSEQLALNPMDPKDLLQTFGLFGVWAILFAETGLLIGFFFPGDSLLFLAGVAASPVANAIFGGDTQMSLIGLLIGAPLCAIAGAQLGHFLGVKYGRRMFERPDSKLFKREYVEKAEYYFEKFGPAKAVVLARFIPIVRTFLNPVAGTLGMPARQFLLWNVVGAILWCDGIILIGYLLAQQIYDAIGDQIDHYILPVVALIVLISVLPILIEMLRERKAKKNAAADPGPATAIGVVAAATVAGMAEAIQDHGHEPDHTHGTDHGYGHRPATAPDPGRDTYGQNHYGQNEHSQNQYGQNQYGPDQYGQDQYGQDPSAQDQYGRGGYGQSDPAPEHYGPDDPGNHRPRHSA